MSRETECRCFCDGNKFTLILCRKQRYEAVLKSLSTKRRIHTMIEELKTIGRSNSSIPDKGVVTVPAESSKRSPVILFIGGGMGAGKSTIVKEVLSRYPFLLITIIIIMYCVYWNITRSF